MPDPEVTRAATTSGLPVAPSMGPTLEGARIPIDRCAIDPRVAMVSALAVLLAVAAAFVAQLLGRLIALVTNVAFFGRWTDAASSPADNHLGTLVVVVPIVGAILVGLMARFASSAIRGHGIPEAMEQVLENDSRIPIRMTFLKPISAAISIGTGGPFGAEGPIIATGSALGSVLGQFLRTTPSERKTLLAAGAAAGMAATFGTPLSALLLAIELLLFEFRAASLIPVALASVTATGIRFALVGSHPAFAMADVAPSATGGSALIGYAIIGSIVGVVSVGVTRVVYAIEDAFDRLPIHWMWWPALGAIAVGVCGFFAPRTLGVGYDNIDGILNASIAGRALAFLCVMKLISWSISLGSGTSGGTLAPLLTIGGALGAGMAEAIGAVLPASHVDTRVAALVGMAAMFAGASRALLASVVFAFEATRQPLSLLPILEGGAAGFFFSSLLMRNSIMTEKIERRGVRVVGEYEVDLLERHEASEVATSQVVTLEGEARAGDVADWMKSAGSSHQGFPVVDSLGRVLGVVMRREIANAGEDRTISSLVARPPVVVFPDSTLREAAEHMAREHVGRLPVVAREAPHSLVGILTRKDVVRIYAHTAKGAQRERYLSVRSFTKRDLLSQR